MQSGTARPYPWRVFREKPVRQMEKGQKIKKHPLPGFLLVHIRVFCTANAEKHYDSAHGRRTGVNSMRYETSSAPATSFHDNPAASLPIPFGWYALAPSDDLAPGDVRPLYYFDQHLVLFRTGDGQAHVTAAFCPHLGAHLGYGGKVEGNAIVCPFHGWRFDGAGVCVDVPYARTIPRRAANGPCLFSYPVDERNRMIWAWHHPRRLPPLFALDDVPELTDQDWSEPARFEWEVNTPIQEAGENAVDVAHFVTVHGASEMPEARITLVGHRRETEVTALVPSIDEYGNIDLARLDKVHIVTWSCGPGMSTQTFELGAKTVMLATVTPITATRMKLCFNFTKRQDTPARFSPLVDGLIAEIVRQVEQDIPIWENKVFRETPILCDGDGPIAKYRRWFSQFYDSAPTASPSRRALLGQMSPALDRMREFWQLLANGAAACAREMSSAVVAFLGDTTGPRYAWLRPPPRREQPRRER